MANVRTVQFSADGARLFTAGYPSGVVQIWDVAHRKVITQIDTPRGYRGSMEYALLTADWSTLYVPVEKRSVKPVERDGKRFHHVEYAGQIRVWDVLSGKEKAPLRPEKEKAPVTIKLAPGGRLLVYTEQASYDTSSPPPREVTVVWELATGKQWKLGEDCGQPSVAPNGKTGVVSQKDGDGKRTVVKLLDLTTGAELARAHFSGDGRDFLVGQVSPDGALVAVWLGGKEAAPVEVWLLDARTLEVRGKLVGKGDPDGNGWGSGRFTPDGKRFVVLDGIGNVLVWNVAVRKLERTLPLNIGRPPGRLAISPDSKKLAVAWAPKGDDDLANAREPDPQDLPQPRVSLIDLAGKAAPRVLMAPHGYVGGLAFSPDGKTLAFGGAGAVHLFDLGK